MYNRSMETITVIYDDTCNLCISLIEKLKDLSKESVVKFIYVGSSSKEVSYLNVPREVYSKEICALYNGKLYTGHHAIGLILSKMPQFRYRLISYGMKVASFAIFAGYLYSLVSRYRYGISKLFKK